MEGIYNVLGAKNLLPITLSNLQTLNTSGTWSDNVYTLNGLTYTVNDDLSVTIDGTASSATTFTLVSTSTSIDANTYAVSGCPSGGAWNTYNMTIKVDGTSSTSTNDYGSGSTVSPTSTIGASIYIVSGYVASDLTFYPMLRLASVSDDTYVPYAMTNKQITDKIDAIITAIEALGGSVD